MSTTNTKSPTSNVKPNRLPAPTLFVGPSSRNASQLSVSRIPTESGGLRPDRQPTDRQPTPRSQKQGDDSPQSRRHHQHAPKIRKPSDKSIDARWREMQSTLNEVELTAQSSTHVFGEAHARALADLRDAQISLAQAWGRGSEGKGMDDEQPPAELDMHRFEGAHQLAADRADRHRSATSGGGAGGIGGRRRADTEASASTVLSDESVLSESSAKSGSGRSMLEDETAQDIRLASERRAANESYFRKVDQGVREVVERLERVAEAMRGVEGEGRSLWGDSGSSSSGSSSGTVEAGREGKVEGSAARPSVVVEGEG